MYLCIYVPDVVNGQGTFYYYYCYYHYYFATLFSFFFARLGAQRQKGKCEGLFGGSLF